MLMVLEEIDRGDTNAARQMLQCKVFMLAEELDQASAAPSPPKLFDEGNPLASSEDFARQALAYLQSHKGTVGAYGCCPFLLM